MLERFFNQITEASLRYKWVTIFLTVILLIGGGFAASQMQLELIPGIEFPQTVILAMHNGTDVEDMRDLVTIPIEEAVTDIDGVVNIESTTSSGVAFIIVMNEFGLDQDALREEILTALEEINFPQGMEFPELLNFSFDDIPVAAVSISSADLTLDELRALVNDEINPALLEVAGVAEVTISGGQELPDEDYSAAELIVEEAAVEEPTQEPTAEPSEDTEPGAGIALPESWIAAASSQGMTIETTDDLSPQFMAAIASMAPTMLADLTPDMILALSVDVIAEIPQEFLAELDSETQAQIAAMFTEDIPEVAAVALPASWISLAALQGFTMETTAELSPEIIGVIASLAPVMLDELTPEMLLAMPLNALAAFPPDYFAVLDPELQAELGERLANYVPEESDPNALPDLWIAAAQTMGVQMETPADLTPEIVNGVYNFAPQLMDMLEPHHLRQVSPEVLGWLPAEYIASLDEELAAELDTLAQSVGGLGVLAAEAAAAAELLSADAPELSGYWREPDPEGNPSQWETAADLINNGYTPSAASFLNVFVNNGAPYMPQMMADLTPTVIEWLIENEEDFLENLDAPTLRLLSAEVLTTLPDEFYASLSSDLSNELQAIAAGMITAFIPTDTINRTNGNPSLGLAIYRDNQSNTVDVTHELFDAFDELEEIYPGLEFNIVFEQASFIEESISGVTREGTLGAIFAVIVILIFLSGPIKGKYKLAWRSTIVTAVSIPLSVFMAFAFLRWMPMLMDPLLAPLSAATKGIPILGTIMAVTASLFPINITLNIMTLSGITVAIGRVVDDSIVVLENIYRQIQRGGDPKEAVLEGTRDVSIAIFASTVTTVVVFLPIGMMGGLIGEFFLPFGVAVTYALSASFLVAITIVPLLAFLFIRKEHLPEEKETKAQKFYAPILEWALRNRATSLAIAAAMLVFSVFLLGQRPQAFIPDMGEPTIGVSIELPSETRMEDTLDLVMEYEQVLLSMEGFNSIESQIGQSGGMASVMFGESIKQYSANLSIYFADGAQSDELVALVREEAESIFGEEHVIVSLSTMSSGAFGGFSLSLSGDPELLAEYDEEVLAVLSGIDGLANVTSNVGDPNTLLRVDGQTSARYTGELETEDTLGVTEAGLAALDEILPDSITVSEGFQTQQQTEGFAQAISAIGISIVIVYAVMVVTFKSFVHPFTILFSLPMAIIGAAIALWITNRVVGLSVLVGFMMLVGIVVTNAIVLISRVQANRQKRDMNTHDALIEAGRTRLRPILMTAIAAMLALIPLALGLTEGAIIATELATVVIGGLFSSTILTLIIVPVMYSFLDQLTTRKAKPE